jgi:nucleoside-diphosphate-sugar epimerase
MAKVLVAGAGGYIGVPLCKKLLERGHSLVALDRFFFGKDRVERIALSERAAVISEDIRDFDPEILNGVEIVVDLAGLSNDASAEIDPELTRSINCGGGIRLARLAKEAGVRRYVYSSSASVYGHGVRERLTENDECRPQSLYAESKLRVEEALGNLAGPEFETVIFRNSTVFGLAPRMRFDLAVNIMTLRAWKERVIYIMGSGEQWRPFVHINDVVQALLLGAEEEAERVAGEVFNVGSDEMNYQIRHLAQFVLDVIPHVTVQPDPRRSGQTHLQSVLREDTAAPRLRAVDPRSRGNRRNQAGAGAWRHRRRGSDLLHAPVVSFAPRMGATDQRAHVAWPHSLGGGDDRHDARGVGRGECRPPNLIPAATGETRAERRVYGV